ncbi:hypothetical protein [Vibrio vulnificus]|uniref:hypothetical protein n=1 Tax=Vibrio vulnificus TaxID=672 RepID=UPI00187D46D6|nr:hypothetical protein [Vibrio vulnificus]ELH9434903.1 hypothetical protein [Vibrio vulnificus]HAS6054698.1 hypothetical protein [Vibrio vulnificus]
MTESIVTGYSDLNNKLKSIPRERIHQYCRENGLHSWHNAQKDPNYTKWRHLAR